MKNMTDRPLMIGAVLVGLIIGVIVFFLGISPKMSAANEARQATQAQESQNSELSSLLAERQRAAELVPFYKERLYDIREILPVIQDPMGAHRAFVRMASDSGVTILQEVIGTPFPAIGGLFLEAEFLEVGLVSEIDEMTFTTLVATPFFFNIGGDFEGLLNFVSSLQLGDHRFFLVQGLTIVQASGREATESVGSLQMSVNGFYFTLDYDNPAVSIRPEGEPLPGQEDDSEPPRSTRNPFLPVVS